MQWRMLEIQATSQNVDFPIAFTEWCVACGSRVTGTGGNPTTLGANAAFSELATLTHARVFSVETQDYYLLAAGVQQWGLFQTAGKRYNAVLSLSYQDWYFPVIAAKQAATEMIGYANLQLNDFDITLGSGDDSERSGAYLCFGKQQWGLTGNDPGNGGASAQLSIPITTLIFGQARTTTSETISSVFSIDVDDGLTLYIDSSNIQYKGGYAYLIGSK